MRLKVYMKSGLTITGILAVVSSLFGQWITSQSSDEMTGEHTSYAISPSNTATEIMDFPYRGVEGTIGVGCDGQYEWVYVSFSKAPNLLNTDTNDGYDRIDTRIKFDDQIQNVTLRQEWGARVLHFYSDDKIIEKLIQSNSILLELNWYGEGRTYFRFSLEGSADAIAEIRKECSNY